MDKIDKYLNESKDENAAGKAWKEYHKAIKQNKLDSIQDRNHQETIDYMYDAFFSGFYAGRDFMIKAK